VTLLAPTAFHEEHDGTKDTTVAPTGCRTCLSSCFLLLRDRRVVVSSCLKAVGSFSVVLKSGRSASRRQ
jgi:hypothetical protein